MSRDFETMYYEQEALHTESNGMLMAQVEHWKAKAETLRESMRLDAETIAAKDERIRIVEGDNAKLERERDEAQSKLDAQTPLIEKAIRDLAAGAVEVREARNEVLRADTEARRASAYAVQVPEWVPVSDPPQDGHYISRPQLPVFAWGGGRYEPRCYVIHLPPLPQSTPSSGVASE